MEINFIAIFAASLVSFIVSALWYSVLFGKQWMRVMETSHMSKEELAKVEKEMIPFYILQFFLTLTTTWVLASNFIFMGLTGSTMYFFAFFMWLGYIAPTQIATVVWGNTKRKFWGMQIAIMLSAQLVSIMLAAFILSLFA